MNVKNILKKCAIALAPTIICIALGLLAGYLILLFSNPAQAGNGFRAILSGGYRHVVFSLMYVLTSL